MLSLKGPIEADGVQRRKKPDPLHDTEHRKAQKTQLFWRVRLKRIGAKSSLCLWYFNLRINKRKIEVKNI